MRKNSYRIYAVLVLGVMFLFSIPAQIQQTLRNQFLKPLLPFGHLIPSQVEKIPKKYPQNKIALEVAPSPSYPNATLSKIIYRNPHTWSDFFWIDLGRASNNNCDYIALHSPVLYDGALIGIVDFVGEKQSRVQLITNSSLTVSVRVLRGAGQFEKNLSQIDELLTLKEVYENPALFKELIELKQTMQKESLSSFLAKGELYGTSAPLWRSKSQILLGRGFNCEFADEYGGPRDFLTGKLRAGDEKGLPIIQPDDLLITTGLDGVFPAGLHVGRVSSVDALVEGGFAYSIQAHPIVKNWNDLRFVEVILPSQYRETTVPLEAFRH